MTEAINTTPVPTSIRDNTLPLPHSGSLSAFGAKRPPTPMTVTEALQDILSRQEVIKRDLDALISDATTLRAQL